MFADPDRETYDVGVEAAGLEWESATPLFARYSVPLSGEIDETWLACYEEAVSSAEFSRFRLDRATQTVSFISKMSDGPAEVATVLRRLRLLIAFVNSRAPRAPETAGAGVAADDSVS